MSDESMKVSIVVPVYNTEQWLDRCIKSICNQSLKEIEILLVDDGSKDCSGEICDKYAAEDRRIHVIHKMNGGAIDARQAGIAAAIGEYVGFMDSDDWAESEMYQTLYEIAVCSGADIVVEGMIEEIGDECCRRLNLLPQGKYETDDEKEKIYKEMISCRYFFIQGIQPYLWNKLIRRELVLKHINGIPQAIRVGEDAAVVYPMLVQAGAIVVSDTAHYHYCHRNTSVMLGERQEEQEYGNAVLLHTFLEQKFRELKVYEVIQEQLQRYTVNNMMTRVYGKFAGMDRETILFPFNGIFQDDSIIIYGAGAFGKAVYQYAISCHNLKVKAWLDQRAAAYQKLGWDVLMLEDAKIEKTDKVIVAVFSEAAYWEIKEKLIIKGVASDHIKWIDQEKLLNLCFI